MRRKSKVISCGNVKIGGDNPIVVQSMTNTDTRDIKSTINQIKLMEYEKCDLVRLAILDTEAAEAIKEIKKEVNIPMIADIHFDHRLALKSIESGIDGLRINPGNIGSEVKVKEVVSACRYKNIPIRIGVNSGSISKSKLKTFGGVNENSLIESAMEHIRILEKLNYENMKISIKTTDVKLTVDTYNKISKLIDYPLHLGITEAGTPWAGTIKSSIGIGSLLINGIGDTFRVSLTGDPIEEIKVSKQILRSLGMLKDRIEIISCPTCGRTEIDLIKMTNKIEEKIGHINKPIKVAIMGCIVNGPGEAREADIGVAGGNGVGLIFKNGEIIKKVSEDKIIEELLKEIEKFPMK